MLMQDTADTHAGTEDAIHESERILRKDQFASPRDLPWTTDCRIGFEL